MNELINAMSIRHFI